MSRKLSKERAQRILAGGAEPQYDPQTKADELDLAIEKALYWYRQNYRLPTAKSWVREYLQSAGRTDDAEICGRADKSHFRFVAPYCRMAVRGFPLGEKFQSLISKHLEELLKNARSNTPTETRPTVQDRIAAKADAVLCDLEPVIDRVVASVQGGKKVDNSLKEWIDRSDLNRPLALIVRDRIQALLDEVAAARDGTDPDLREGYSHFKKTSLKHMVDNLNSAVSVLNDRLGVLKASRKPRKRKAKSAESQIKKLNYCPRNEQFGVDSAKPEAIIGAQGLIVFNTNTNKATVFVASEAKSGLGVKGSTLTGFDPAKSFEKTVRKPDEFLKNADGCRKTFASAVRYLSGVKTKNSEPTGRINKHCLLLQVN
jgi:hypothetical protein